MNSASVDPITLRAALLNVLIWIWLPGEAQVPCPPTDPVPAETASPLTPGKAHLEEAQIDRFADAYIAVEAIQSNAAQKLRTTEDPQKAFEVKADAEGEIIEAVERSGLKLDEFNEIAEMMAADRELRLKIADRVRVRRNL
jgi:uncharacterized protein DUF4168